MGIRRQRLDPRTAGDDQLSATAATTISKAPTATTRRAADRTTCLKGGALRDGLYGQSGNDRLEGGAGNDHMDGGSGTDTAVYTGSGAANVNLVIGRSAAHGARIRWPTSRMSRPAAATTRSSRVTFGG